MTKVLVTGASGFIGGYLIDRLRARGDEVVAVDRRTGDVAASETWRGLERADVVVHLAARSFVPDSWTSPTEFVRTNLLGTVAALGYCRDHDASLVFLSSYLYGTPAVLPIAESAPLAATNPYALSKKLAEEACAFFAGAFTIPVTVLRPFNVYGAGQPESFLIPSIIRQVTSGTTVCVKDLAPRRDYVHVVDLVDAIILAIGRTEPYDIFNIGSGSSHSVSEVIATIQSTWGTQLPVKSDEVRREGEILDTVADASKAARGLRWTPRLSLEQGMADIRRRMLPTPATSP